MFKCGDISHNMKIIRYNTISFEVLYQGGKYEEEKTNNRRTS